MQTIVKNLRGHRKKELVAFDVDIEIDVYALAALLGRKALANKSGKSRFADGLIKVSVRGKPEPVAASGSRGPIMLENMLNSAFGRKG